ncbi:YfcC family protein [Panacibacter sp. DH6]|uniref:YfcC family protein n=1 Tax=Panacibacter microcysteis TaxID=2793269 RepID=A0A931E5N6_9BACT|nr:YfcC family protein [Panacibacter microcysteis]MBG9376637.1 YfcC family protein [Panacibacter microcysteis]
MAKKRGFPAPLTIIMIVIVLAAIATWFVPAGSYNRLSYGENHFVLTSKEAAVTLPATQETLDSLGIKIALEKFSGGDIRKPVAVPGTYNHEPAERQGIISVLQAPFKGMYDTIDIILFILATGGFIAIFYESGALEKGIQALGRKMTGKENSLIIIFTFLFALGGSSYGMAEETIAFYPLLVPIFLAAGFDLLVPVAVIFLGSTIGTMAAVTCPFSVIIASNAAGINWVAGTGGRIIMFVLCTAVTISYILYYGKKVKRDPSCSFVRRFDGDVKPKFTVTENNDNNELSLRDKFVLLLFALTFGMLVYGVVALGWWLLEMSALFFASSLLLALIIRTPEKTFVAKFIRGAEDLLSVAFIVGFARGVTIILNDGHISDSILYYAAGIIQGMPPALFIISIFVLYLFLSIFIASSSGMAVLTMPIIAPLGVMIGMDNLHIVNAYLFGMGIMNIITPTGLVLPALTMVNVSYKTWLRFILPLLVILFFMSIIYLLIGVLF